MIEIRHYVTGQVLFQKECENIKLAVEAAIRDRANLSGAILSGVKIFGVEITKTPIQISGLKWQITILDTHIRIGCRQHSIDEWDSLDDRQISQMADDALELWKTHKDWIMSLARIHEVKTDN